MKRQGGLRATSHVGIQRLTGRKSKTEGEGRIKRWSNWRKECGACALCPLVCQEMSGCVGGGMVMAAVGRPDWHPERPGRWEGRGRGRMGVGGRWSGRKVTAGPGERRWWREGTRKQLWGGEEEEEDVLKAWDEGWNRGMCVYPPAEQARRLWNICITYSDAQYGVSMLKKKKKISESEQSWLKNRIFFITAWWKHEKETWYTVINKKKIIVFTYTID